MGVQDDVEVIREMAGRDLGATVRTRRAEKGWSQRFLADRMSDVGFKWHQTTVAKTESGTRPVHFEEVLGLALLLGVPSLNEMLGEASEIPTRLVISMIDQTEEEHRRTVAALRAEIDKISPGGATKFDQMIDEAESEIATKFAEGRAAIEAESGDMLSRLRRVLEGLEADKAGGQGSDGER